MQKPHPFPHVGHHVPSDTRPQCRYARKYSPNEAPPTALPRQSSPSKPKNTNFGVFSARWANFIAHWAQQRGDDATTATTAAADAGQRETAITTAHPRTATVETNDTSATEKHAKNTHFSPAKAMTVSVEAQPARAKAMTVSTCPRHQPAKTTRVSTPHGNEQAKATPVPDNRTPGLRARATTPAGIYTPTPQKTRT
mgnify:CR=1 FL=1